MQQGHWAGVDNTAAPDLDDFTLCFCSLRVGVFSQVNEQSGTLYFGLLSC